MSRRVRAEINLPNMPAGSEHDVDEDDEWIRSLISGGFLSLMDRRSPVPCYCCDPPSFWETSDGRDVHASLEHPGEWGCDGRSR